MAYLWVTFDKPIPLVPLRKLLAHFGFVEMQGDWHADRLNSARIIAKEIGISQSSAPLRSIEEDRERCGGAEKVQLTLSSGECLTGQLRRSGLLVSNKFLTASAILEDENVQLLISEFRAIDEHCETEIA